MSDQSTTTTTPSGVDQGIAGQGLPPTNTVTATTPIPTAIGAAKYQTVGGEYVYLGTKYQRVIKGANGKYYAIDAAGSVMQDDKGNPIEDAPQADRLGNPTKAQAQFAAPDEPTPSSAISAIPVGGMQKGAVGPARYDEGADWSIFASMPAEQRMQVQQAMIDRGLAPTSGAATDGFSLSWLNAFKTVLGYANNNNQTWDDALRSMPPVDRTSVATITPTHHTITLDSPQDLAAVFRKAAASMIGGGGVDESTVQEYVRAYQEMQRQDQEAKNHADDAAAMLPSKKIRVDAQGNPIDTSPPGTDILGSLPDNAAAASGPPAERPSTTTTTTTLESPQQFAQDQIKQKYAGRYQATNMANSYGLFMNSISKVGAGAPSTQGTAGP